MTVYPDVAVLSDRMPIINQSFAAAELAGWPAPAPRRRFLRWLTSGVAGAAGAAGLVACVPDLSDGGPGLPFAGDSPAEATQVAPQQVAPQGEPVLPAPSVEPALPAVAPRPAPAPGFPVFYRPEYALAAFSFETTRKARWVADSLAQSSYPGLELTAPEMATEADVLTIHDATYVAAVRTGQPRSMAESQGFRWDAGLWPAVLAANGGIVAAGLAALERGVAGSLSSGLHHARRARGNGYCTFNGLVLAARAALAGGAQNVLIVDLDAHCGGGTNELIGTHPNVWIVDVAVNTFDRYGPFGHNTLDVVGAARQYVPTVRTRLEALPGRAPAFDLCLYNAGMDPHEGCPIGGLGGVNRTVLQEREAMVFEWCRRQGIPVAFSLAGGYLGPRLNQQGLTAPHRVPRAAAAGIAHPPTA